MLPLIPKVRTGDVLRGSRHLRNLLRTASILETLVNSPVLGGPKKERPRIFSPSREDEFVVAINSWNCFGTFLSGTKQPVMLLFSNHNGSRRPTRGRKPLLRLPPQPRMNPNLFSHWFVKTNKRKPNLNSWPPYAYKAWVMFHLNANNIRPGEFCCPWPDDGLTCQPFTLPSSMDSMCPSEVAKKMAMTAGPHGVTRPNALSRSESSCPKAWGPVKTDQTRMEKQIGAILRELQAGSPKENAFYKAYGTFLEENGIKLNTLWDSYTQPSYRDVIKPGATASDTSDIDF